MCQFMHLSSIHLVLHSLIIDMSRDSKSPGPPIEDAHKIFLTNIEGTYSEDKVTNDLQPLFEKVGQMRKFTIKRNKTGEYFFGFVEYETSEGGHAAMRELDQYEYYGKRVRVRIDKPSQGCFHCGQSGHLAKECPQRTGKSVEQSRRERYERNQARDTGHQYERGRGQTYMARDDRPDRRYRDYDRYDSRQRYQRRYRRRTDSYERDHYRHRHRERQDSRDRYYRRRQYSRSSQRSDSYRHRRRYRRSPTPEEYNRRRGYRDDYRRRYSPPRQSYSRER